MPEDITPANQSKPRPTSPVYRVGDTVVFKFEGNLRARIEGFEVAGGRVRLDCRAFLGFLVPYSQVVGVERED